MKIIKLLVGKILGIMALVLIAAWALTWGWQVSTRCIIPPVLFIPSSINQPRPEIGVGRTWRMAMPSWWKLQPDKKRSFLFPKQDNVRDIAIQNQNVWLAYDHVVQRYIPETSETFTYNIVDTHNNALWVLDLLVTQDGHLWTSVGLPGKDYYTLAHYNTEKDSFEIVLDRDNVLVDQKGKIHRGSFSNGPLLAEANDSRILMFFGENILLYTPNTNTAQLLLPVNFGFTINSIAFSQNKVWFTVYNPDFSFAKDIELWSLDVSTSVIENYGPAPIGSKNGMDEMTVISSYGAITVDHLGRVWMGYFARLEKGNNGQYQWYSIPYPSEFISGDDPEYRYGWAKVSSIDISSNGDLWFSSSAGLIRYDVDQNTWCISAPGKPASVAEDKNGNLWIVPINSPYQGLYQYKLKP